MHLLKKFFSFFVFIVFSFRVDCLLSFPEDLKSKNILFHSVENETNLFERNAHEKAYPASITKIVTYIVVYENIKDKNEEIIADKELLDSLNGTDSSLANLKPGKSYSTGTLLESMMVCSGNDSALILANHIGCGVPNFISMMNQKSKDLGCNNTHFVNPHGLHDENHYSTCADLLKIIKYAMKIEDFKKTVRTVSFNLDGNTVINTNKLLNPKNSKYYLRYCYGVKTGSHDEAGFCLSSAAGNDELGNYICICLGAPKYDEHNEKMKDNYAMLDSKKLYEWAFSNYKLVEFPIGSIKFPSLETNKYNIPIDYEIKPFPILIPVGTEISDINYKFCLPDNVDVSKPLEKGSLLGSLVLDIPPNTTKCVDVYSKNSLSANFYQKFVWLLSFL